MCQQRSAKDSQLYLGMIAPVECRMPSLAVFSRALSATPPMILLANVERVVIGRPRGLIYALRVCPVVLGNVIRAILRSNAARRTENVMKVSSVMESSVFVAKSAALTRTVVNLLSTNAWKMLAALETAMPQAWTLSVVRMATVERAFAAKKILVFRMAILGLLFRGMAMVRLKDLFFCYCSRFMPTISLLFFRYRRPGSSRDYSWRCRNLVPNGFG